ncbi:MAG TPA: hypothetical protein VFW64_08625 [Pseudonocardiaceae bacterium]|nr:hypothetical protein [Pseudonocardiaceae bacterium]
MGARARRKTTSGHGHVNGDQRAVNRRRPRATRAQLLMRGLNASVTGNAQAFGFSITVTVTFGVISSAQGNPSRPELIGFALSSVAAFSMLNLLVARLVETQGSGSGTTRAMLIGTATDFLAVGAAVGAAIGICYAVGGWVTWILAPFLAGLVYVLVQSVELAVGQSQAQAEDE